MYVIPIIIKPIETTNDTIIKQVWVFLERNGTHCISVGSVKEAHEFAAINDIQVTGAPIIAEPFIYLPVNSTADLSSFYLWHEVRLNEHPMKGVWRSFLWIVGAKSEEDVWGTNKFLKEICVAGTHSVHAMIEGYFKTSG